MVQRMEDQLAKEGVDVRGVSNVMEEMSRRNRELFQLPTWVLVCWLSVAFSTLWEGMSGLSVDVVQNLISTQVLPVSPADSSRTIRLELEQLCRR